MVMVKIRFGSSVWLVSSYAYVFVPLAVVIVCTVTRDSAREVAEHCSPPTDLPFHV